MRSKKLAHAVVLVLLGFSLLASCNKVPAAPSGDTPTGRWTGNYEVTPGRNEPISVDLRWENTDLRGTVMAGVRSIPISKAAFQRDTGAINLEFDAQGNGGQIVHYVIDGKVAGNTMTGTWSHGDQRGEFKVTKE
jgi:hypothetical protein